MEDTRLSRKLKYFTAQRVNVFHSRRSKNDPSDDKENIVHRTTKHANVPHYHRLTLALSEYSGYTSHTHDQGSKIHGRSFLNFTAHNVKNFDGKHNKQEEISESCSAAYFISSEVVSQRQSLGNSVCYIHSSIRTIKPSIHKCLVFTAIFGCFYLSFFSPNNNTPSLRRLISATQDDRITIKGLPGDSALSELLPLASEVNFLYGNSPVVKGTDQCQKFRSQVELEHRQIVPIGLFATGSGLLHSLINMNCFHSHPAYSQTELIDKETYTNVTGNQKAFKNGHALPIVIIQDPVYWMSSMCQYDGSVIWNKADDRCPNIIPNEYDVGFNPDGTVGVAVGDIQFSSLIDMWNKYYGQWMDDDSIPRLIVRLEDLLFHADHVVKDICQCAGWEVRENFQFIDLDTAGKDLDVIDDDVISAMSRHGSKNERDGVILYENERIFVQNETRKDLMTNFRYPSFQQLPHKPLGLFKMI